MNRPHTAVALATTAALALSSCHHSDMKLMRELAQEGNAEAQYAYGRALLLGKHAPKSPEQAVEWLQASAEQDNADAYAALGVCHAKGIGLPKDPEKALQYLKKAADLGHPYATRTLFQIAIASGKKKEAHNRLQQMANERQPDAELLLGVEALKKKPKNQKEIDHAVDLIRYSAMSGNPEACSIMASFYSPGGLLQENECQAKGWRKMADEAAHFSIQPEEP